MYVEMGDMMVKGFIFFKEGKMPFVIENYRMELFTDDSLLDDFCKEYNFKENYILHGRFHTAESSLLSNLPRGSLICRKKEYYYLKYRENGKIYDKYRHLSERQKRGNADLKKD